MNQVNPHEAPPGMVAFQSIDCADCYYYRRDLGCPEIGGGLACVSPNRADGCEVMFKEAAKTTTDEPRRVNPDEAPEGMVAVEVTARHGCDGCIYDANGGLCKYVDAEGDNPTRVPSAREDGCTVIFQHKPKTANPLQELELKRAQLAQQAAELEAQIAEHKAQLRADAISSIQAQMLEHGISVAELESGEPAGDEVVRYADGAGNTWDGSGQMPRWMMMQYAVECYRRGRAGEPRLSERDFAERFRLGGAA